MHRKKHTHESRPLWLGQHVHLYLSLSLSFLLIIMEKEKNQIEQILIRNLHVNTSRQNNPKNQK